MALKVWRGRAMEWHLQCDWLTKGAAESRFLLVCELRHQGRTLSIPGHRASSQYTSATEWMEGDRPVGPAQRAAGVPWVGCSEQLVTNGSERESWGMGHVWPCPDETQPKACWARRSPAFPQEKPKPISTRRNAPLKFCRHCSIGILDSASPLHDCSEEGAGGD